MPTKNGIMVTLTPLRGVLMQSGRTRTTGRASPTPMNATSAKPIIKNNTKAVSITATTEL